MRGERLAQLVCERAGQLSEHRDTTEVGQLAPLDAGIDLGLLPIADVPDDGEDLVTVAADDARFVVPLALNWSETELQLLGLARQTRSVRRVLERLGQGRRKDLVDAPAEEPCRRHEQLGRFLRVVVEEHAFGRDHEHPVGDGAKDGLIARLAATKRLLSALVFDGNARDVGRGFDQAELVGAGSASLGVVHGEGAEHGPA